jgi:hypothetical protein
MGLFILLLTEICRVFHLDFRTSSSKTDFQSLINVAEMSSTSIIILLNNKNRRLYKRRLTENTKIP